MHVRDRWRLFQVGGVALVLAGMALPVSVIALRSKRYKSVRELEPVAFRPEMVELYPGTITPARFWMGSPEDEPGRRLSEIRHEVELTRPFAIARTEVTQAQWTAVMGKNPSLFQEGRGGGPDHPVERVSWYDSILYCNRLSELERRTPCYRLIECIEQERHSDGCSGNDIACDGRYRCEKVKLVERCDGYRLLTEAEWEYAARAGTTAPTYVGQVGLSKGVRDTVRAPDLDRVARYIGNSASMDSPFDCSVLRLKDAGLDRCGTGRVGTKRANDWGLYDVLGNVWEWVSDDYQEDFGLTDVSVVTDPHVYSPSSGRDSVVRGCGFDARPVYCRAADRGRVVRAWRLGRLGFRPARSIPRSWNH